MGKEENVMIGDETLRRRITLALKYKAEELELYLQELSELAFCPKT